MEVEALDELAPITEAQWERILKGGKFALLVNPEQQEWAGKRAVRCGNCTHTTMRGDPRRGFCVRHRVMVSDTFPKLCRAHEYD